MVEAHDGLAVLDDVEADIFVGFREFVYTGDYRSRSTEREPEIAIDDPATIQRKETHHATSVEWEERPAPAAEEATPIQEEYWGYARPEQNKKKTQTTQIERIWNNFQNLTYEDPTRLVGDGQAT